MTYKRYQYLGQGGEVKWTDWFKYDGPMEKWQLKNQLKNEYKTVE